MQLFYSIIVMYHFVNREHTPDTENPERKYIYGINGTF